MVTLKTVEVKNNDIMNYLFVGLDVIFMNQ